MAIQHVRKVPFQRVTPLDKESQRQLSRNFDALVAQVVPTGTVVPWAGQDGLDPPQGWALCDGTHPGPGNGSLFRVIGTTFGGSTVNDFLTPNMSDRFPRGTHLGSEVGDTGGSATGVQSHAHTMSGHGHAITVNSNNFNTLTVSNWHTHHINHTEPPNHAHNCNASHIADGADGNWSGAGQRNNFSGPFHGSSGIDTSGVISGLNHNHSANFPSGGGAGGNHTHNANHFHTASSGGPSPGNTSTDGQASGNLPPFTDFRFIIKT